MSLSAYFVPFAVLLVFTTALDKVDAATTCTTTTWNCQPISSADAPTLDGDLTDWDEMGGDAAFTTSLSSPLAGMDYMEGEASTYKCVYDENRIYFSLEIPGDYRFNATNNKQCASIATMTKIGKDATFVNMGGCPDAMGGCEDGVPDTCETYRVDIGAHWELRTTQQGVAYNVPETTTVPEVAGQVDDSTTLAAGDDPIANNDDEYAVSSFCRFDDNDANAGNEWAGAWVHTNPVEGEYGMYKFEVSRSLKTASNLTDAQFTPGSISSFGVAFWDPFETESGWTDAGHFVSGCGSSWVDLMLVTPASAGEGSESTGGGSSEGSIVSRSSSLLAGISVLLLSFLF